MTATTKPPTLYIGSTLIVLIDTFNRAGVAADPTALTVELDGPTTATVTYTYGSSAELTKVGTGLYEFAVPVFTVAGRFECRAVGTGANASARQGAWIVTPKNTT
jgi:hypothetical protein